MCKHVKTQLKDTMRSVLKQIDLMEKWTAYCSRCQQICHRVNKCVDLLRYYPSGPYTIFGQNYSYTDYPADKNYHTLFVLFLKILLVSTYSSMSDVCINQIIKWHIRLNMHGTINNPHTHCLTVFYIVHIPWQQKGTEKKEKK